MPAAIGFSKAPPTYPGRTRTLDSHASRLRKKLGLHSDAAWIANVWGICYRLCRPE
jgi:DNA-binding response OmpR family regulator